MLASIADRQRARAYHSTDRARPRRRGDRVRKCVVAIAMHWLAAWSSLGVIRVISWVRQPLPVYTNTRSIAALRRTDVPGQSRYFTLQQTASVPASAMRFSSECRIRFNLLWRKPITRFVLHDLPCKVSERTIIGGRNPRMASAAARLVTPLYVKSVRFAVIRSGKTRDRNDAVDRR